MNDSTFWSRTATRLARRFNLGRWLETTLPAWAGASVVVACALLVLRNRGANDLAWFWVATVAAFIVTGALIYAADTRRRRIVPAEVLVWLEHRLGLNNRLSAASAGVGEWPAPDERAHELLKWRASRILTAPLFSAAIIAAAALVPVSLDETTLPPPLAPPLAWTEMERWLDELDETELVDEQAIDTWQERVESLKTQPEDEWYSHSSLEAGDSLRDELASELRALERGLTEAEASLSEMIELDENASPEKRRLARQRLGKALDDLELATLPVSREIKRQLMTLTRERDVRPMDQEQLERLRERLRGRQYASLPRPGDEAYAFRTPEGTEGSSSSERPGRGGVNRGPASAPLELADERTELDTSRIEDVIGREPLGTELGDNVAVGIGEHDIDTSGFRRGQEAGAVAASGEGGELVWSQTLTPEERRVLKKYFK